MKLTPDQEKWLKWFDLLGGDGVVDQYGRLVAGGEVAAQGAAVCWLKLIAGGLITGTRDRLYITAQGKAELEAIYRSSKAR